MANRQPTYSAKAVVLSDTANTNIWDGFMLATTAGNVKVTTDLGSDVVFASVPLNTPIPVRVTRIFETLTVGTGVIGLKYNPV
jgi:hypothetical protein